MSDAYTILTAPTQESEMDWFVQVSELLLNQTEFMIGGKPHRFLEIEYYLKNEKHPDPFVHGDPVQQTCGQWYFHRDEGSYRGGSFKGLDISFGPEGDFGGILIRTIADHEGNIVNGCSLCVDHMLKVTEHENIASLDGLIAERKIWDESSPLHLRFSEALPKSDVLATARVGLTLKRMYKFKDMPEYIMKPYRFLTEPKIKKGKLHTIMALYKAGMDPEEIRTTTSGTRKSIQGYIDSFAEGQSLENFNGFRGKALKVGDLCRLHGAWNNHFEDGAG